MRLLFSCLLSTHIWSWAYKFRYSNKVILVHFSLAGTWSPLSYFQLQMALLPILYEQTSVTFKKLWDISSMENSLKNARNDTKLIKIETITVKLYQNKKGTKEDQNEPKVYKK